MVSLVRYKVVDKNRRVHLACNLSELIELAREIERNLGPSALEITPEIAIEEFSARLDEISIQSSKNDNA